MGARENENGGWGLKRRDKKVRWSKQVREKKMQRKRS